VAAPQQMHPIPNSPPPSFHSRASSRERRRRVDPALADAFDTDGDESEDESDDRQRLVRNNSFPTESAESTAVSNNTSSGPVVEQPATQVSSGSGGSRVYGGGIQADGVFSNLSAKPERAEAEKDEQPPV
jgi:Protein of unknown function (DUF2370)